MTEKYVDLPYGYSVKHNFAVGYEFYDEDGELVMQHPCDNGSIRRLVGSIYKKRLEEKDNGKE